MVIEVSSVTKIFTGGRGVFDVDLSVAEGEILGFIGPNGAGKSTTIRHLMGFLKPDRGTTRIAGYDCWSEPELAHKSLGYLPGEIAFPSGISAARFLQLQNDIQGASSTARRNGLVDRFQLDLKAPILQMSKGMKQKLAIVAAFQSDPAVVILDEPSSGLDPVMQEELITLLLEEKQRGKTILLSSHIFEEVETLADRVSIIRAGRIVENQLMSDIEAHLARHLVVTFANEVSREDFSVPVSLKEGRIAEFSLSGNYDEILGQVTRHSVINLKTSTTTLREFFHDKYSEQG
ncbi:ABC transporter ATP-binding protein [Glutamicibacter ardleyensis]|uniref:ABC transporter ATP-binding protein n=1 Tax=Glutamicibacter ardleyensis TaxID=225894 RepID=UPI003FD5943E